MARIHFIPSKNMSYNIRMNFLAAICIIIFVMLFQPYSVAKDESDDPIKLYDSEMLLKDMCNEPIPIGNNQRPLVQNHNKNGKPAALDVPRSVKYDTMMLDEGVRLYKSGDFKTAAAAFEAALDKYRAEGFDAGEIAVLGNLYLTYLAMGSENKAIEYLEEYRKKRRKK